MNADHEEATIAMVEHAIGVKVRVGGVAAKVSYMWQNTFVCGETNTNVAKRKLCCESITCVAKV